MRLHLKTDAQHFFAVLPTAVDTIYLHVSMSLMSRTLTMGTNVMFYDAYIEGRL